MKYCLAIVFLFVSVCTFAQEANDHIYNIAEVSKAPRYPGGTAAFYRSVSQNFSVDGLQNREGQIVVEFVVEKDSTISRVKVLKAFGANSGREAVRVVRAAGKWIPGEIDGQPVRTRHQVPIQIQKAPAKP